LLHHSGKDSGKVGFEFTSKHVWGLLWQTLQWYTLDVELR